MIFVYILVSVLSGFSALIGVGGAIFATYYLVSTGDLLYLAAATLSAIFAWLAVNLNARTRAFVSNRDYRRELSSLLQVSGGSRARLAYFLLWFFAAVGILAALVVAGIDTLTALVGRNSPYHGSGCDAAVPPNVKRLGPEPLEDAARQEMALKVEGVLDGGMD